MVINRILFSRREDAIKIGGALREQDKQELWAAGRWEPRAAVLDGFNTSVLCWTAFRGASTVAMFGATRASLLGNVGTPWFLATDEILRMNWFVLANTKPYINEIRRHFSLLENWVDARNKIAIKWIKWMGFNIEAPEPYGIEKLLFHRFWMEGK